MTVAELIEALRLVPPDLKVFFDGDMPSRVSRATITTLADTGHSDDSHQESPAQPIVWID